MAKVITDPEKLPEYKKMLAAKKALDKALAKKLSYEQKLETAKSLENSSAAAVLIAVQRHAAATSVLSPFIDVNVVYQYLLKDSFTDLLPLVHNYDSVFTEEKYFISSLPSYLQQPELVTLAKSTKSAKSKYTSAGKKLLSAENYNVKYSAIYDEKNQLYESAIVAYNSAAGNLPPPAPPPTPTPTPKPQPIPTPTPTEPVTRLSDAQITANSVATTDLNHYKSLSNSERNTAYEQAISTLINRVSKGNLSYTLLNQAAEILRRRIIMTSSIY